MVTLGEAPPKIVPVQNETSADSLNARPICEEKEDKQQQLEQHRQVTKTDQRNQKEDRKNQLNFNQKNDEYRQDFDTLMSKFSLMCDGHLGRILVTKHHIQLSMETPPIYSHPYRAGPRQIQFERDEVDKILKDNVAKAATS